MQILFYIFALLITLNLKAMEKEEKIISFPKNIEELIVDYVNYEHWQKEFVLIGHQDAITSISISSDGTLLASGSNDKTVKLWNLVTQEEILSLFFPSKIDALAISRDKKYLAILFANCFISIVDLSLKCFLHQNINFAEDLYNADLQNKAINAQKFIPELSTKHYTEILKAHSKLSKNNEYKAKIANWESCKPILFDMPRIFSISPDNKYIIYANTIFLKRFNIKNGELEEQFVAKGFESFKETFKNYLLMDVQFEDNKNIWNYYYGNSCNLSPIKNKYILVTTYNRINATANDDQKNEVLITPINKDDSNYLERFEDYLRFWSFSDQYDYLVEHLVKQTLENAIKLTGHTDLITSLVFSPNGKFLASGSKDTTIIIWKNQNYDLFSK